MKCIVLAASVALAMGLPAAAGAANIIVNPGFDSGTLSPWFNDRDFSAGGTPWAATTDEAHTGAWSAGNVGDIEIRQNFAGVDSDDVLAASLWLKHPGLESNLPGFVSFFYSDATNSGGLILTSGSEWEFFDVLSFLAPGKTLTGFSVFGYSGGSDAPDLTYLDDVIIDVGIVPEPASWTMMIAGFGLVGGTMRRRTAALAA